MINYPPCFAVLLSCRTLAGTLELLEKQVQCAICLETYRDPKALTCLHAYCRECIQQLLLQQQRDQKVECPQCRSVVAIAGNDPSSLPSVFFINGLIEVCEILKKAKSNKITCQNCSESKATSFCHTCSMFICVNCTSAHSKMKVFEGHKTVPIYEMKERSLIQLPTKKPPTSTCKKHEEEMKLYCFECEQLICRDCTLIDHANHKFDFVKCVTDAFRDEVLSSLACLRDTHISVTTAIERVEGTKKEIKDQGSDIATTITQSFKELRDILNSHEHVLLQQAQDVMGKKVSALDKQLEDLQVVLVSLDSLMGFMEQMVKNASDEEFISMKQQVTNRVQEVSEKYKCLELAPTEVANIGKVVPQPDSFQKFFQKQSAVYISVLDTSKCHISGPGIKSATIKKVSKFTVRIHDTHSQPPTVYSQPTPFQHLVSAELKSLLDDSVLQATVVSQNPSTYLLSYTPKTRGRHQLIIRVNNTEIGTFQVFVWHPPTQLGTPVRVIEGVKPYYIAVGDKGKLFVTEHSQDRYIVLDAQGQKVLTVGSKLMPPFVDGYPTGIATDGKGNVYVASASHKVRKFNKYGEEVWSIGGKGSAIRQFHCPWCIKYYYNQVYVCDSYNGRIQVFDPNLNFLRSFGTHGDGPGQLKDPSDIAFDGQGNTYVVDSAKRQVLVFSEDGQYLRHFGQRKQGKHELSGPAGLCISGNYVYVVENATNSVSVFCTSGEFVHSFGNRGSGWGELQRPWGIAVDQDGFVFVCDLLNSRIQVF